MQRGKLYIGDKSGNTREGKITSALPASSHGVNTMIAWTSASQPYPMIIQKTYRLEKFIDSVLPVECMSQPPALRATSFQRKEGKIIRSSSSWNLPSLQSLLFFPPYFIFAFTSSVRSAEMVPQMIPPGTTTVSIFLALAAFSTAALKLSWIGFITSFSFLGFPRKVRINF